jgi:alpha-beta hydrolase superfamily lysophospholipase
MIRIRDLSHIRIERVEFPSAGGSVRGLLYHSRRPATCIILCHGYSSSKHNVDPLAYYLAAEGYIALAFDFLGHKLGSSSLPLAHAKDLMTNALDAIAYARALPDVHRLVIGGHSMGAAVSIAAAARSPEVHGVIAMSTALHRGRQLAGDGLQSGLSNRSAYVEGASPHDIALAMDEFTAHVGEIAPRPLLVIAGSKDAIVAPSAVRTLFDKAGEPKTFELIDANHTDTAERARFVVLRWLRATGFEYAPEKKNVAPER